MTNTSERDEIAGIIWDKTDCRDEGAPDIAAEKILEAGYRRAPEGIGGAVRALVQEQIEGAQQDGMKLGIKFGAKTLRGIADELGKESTNADYIRGLRDAAVLIEQFAASLTMDGGAA